MRDGIVMGQPAVWIFDEERGEKTNGWCVLRMRLQACSGAERQNGIEQRGNKGLRNEKSLLWEREVAE
jgi:hypothetical protein